MLLFWWRGNCGSRHRKTQAVHWAGGPPECHQVSAECLGSLNSRSLAYSVGGVTLDGPRPVMPTKDEETAMLAVLQAALEQQTGWRVSGLRRGLVSW